MGKREALSVDLDKWTERRDWHRNAVELCDRKIEETLGEIAVLRSETLLVLPEQRNDSSEGVIS